MPVLFYSNSNIFCFIISKVVKIIYIFPFAMSKDGLLPSYLAGVNSKFMTPVSAILTTSTLIALAIIFLDVVKIAKLASAFKVLMFIFNELTVIVLRETNAQC